MEALDELSMNGISALHELAAMRAEKVRQPARCFRGVVHQGGTSQRQGDTTARACVSTTSLYRSCCCSHGMVSLRGG